MRRCPRSRLTRLQARVLADAALNWLLLERVRYIKHMPWGVYRSLIRQGLLTRDCQVTEAGRAALRVCMFFNQKFRDAVSERGSKHNEKEKQL